MTEETQQKKVGIIIITYNISSEIFLLQIAAIKKFCKDDFTIHVFDNSTDKDLAENIRYHASHLGLDYIKTFAGGKDSSDSHAFCANFAYQKLKDKYQFFFYADHDLIPVMEFSIIDILNGGHVMAGIGQEKIKKYYWPGCLMWRNSDIDKELIDFSPEAGLDTGGSLWKVIEKYGGDSCVFFNESYHENPYFKSKDYGSYAMINNQMFMHFVASSNWVKLKNHQERISSLINVAKEKTGL